MTGLERFIEELTEYRRTLNSAVCCFVGEYASGERNAVKFMEMKARSTAEEEKAKELVPKMGGLVCPHCNKVVAEPSQAASYLGKEQDW